VIHVVAERFTDLTDELGRMREEPAQTRPGDTVRTRLVRSRDFH
jgi:error-prone DNA polymerase